MNTPIPYMHHISTFLTLTIRPQIEKFMMCQNVTIDTHFHMVCIFGVSDTLHFNSEIFVHNSKVLYPIILQIK